MDFANQLPGFDAQMGPGQNGEDWQDWLRWDPAAEANSPDDGTFNSASSKNDSPLQDALLPDFSGAAGDEPLVPPMIVGDDGLGFGSDGGFLSNTFTFGTDEGLNPGFDFDRMPDNVHGLPDIPKLDTNLSGWPLDPSLAPESNVSLSALSPENTAQLHSALSMTATTPSLHHSPESSSHTRTSISSDSLDPPKKRGGRKRKAETQLEKNSPEDVDNMETNADGEPVKKTSHNVIEKRYRNNLNDKITELRNSVPSLRAMSRANNGDGTEDLEGLTPAHKLNKATVMAKATEYIRHLEKRNKTMSDEMDALKAQLAQVEAAIGKSKDRQTSITHSPSFGPVRSREASSASHAGSPIFLNVPQDQSRFNQSTAQQQYMQQQGQPTYARPPNPPVQAQNQPQPANGRGSGFVNKALMGGMATLMAAEGYGEFTNSGEDSSGRLSAIPITLLRRSGSMPTSQLARQAAIPILKLFLVIYALGFLLASLVSYLPRRKQKIGASMQLPKAPSLASPVEVRRKAWDTAIQSVWVPKHFLLEVVAVGFKMLSLSLRRIIGSEAFTNITGTTKEEEAARIKAWDIAIDAQLAGGDSQVSYYRLLLTLMESGTLPDSPARLMQKAVHFRVFFWEVANAGYGNMVGFKQFTERVGRFYWESAHRQHKDIVNAKSSARARDEDAVEALPDHLARLVELDCDEVLSDEMIQRAWNLAWNKPSAHRTVANAARDSVVEDHAIRAPLDAVAAWYSNATIDETLADALGDGASVFDTEYYIGLALSVAPPASGTHVRALAAKAVLSNSNRESNIVVALDALPVLSPTGGMNLVNHAPASPDICTALTVAKLISLSSPSSSRVARDRAFSALNNLQLAPADFTLLSAVATFRLLKQLSMKQGLPESTEHGIEDLAASLRLWIGTSPGGESGIDREGRSKIVKLCLTVAKQLGGWNEKDSGYGSSNASPVRTGLVMT